LHLTAVLLLGGNKIDMNSQPNRNPAHQPPPQVIADLAAQFEKNGCTRWPDLERRSKNPREYKKGYEVRLAANSMEELRVIRRALRDAGFKPARPFAKATEWRQPLYGRREVLRFLELIGQI
jgi:hypothetical protein